MACQSSGVEGEGRGSLSLGLPVSGLHDDWEARETNSCHNHLF